MKKIKIDFVNFYLFSVPVRFDISHLRIYASHHLLAVLETGGRQGMGEGVLYQTSPLKTLCLLEKEINLFFEQRFVCFKDAREKLRQNFSQSPGIVCAFDLALWDLEGKLRKRAVFELLAKKKPAEKISAIEQIFIPGNKKRLIEQANAIIKTKTKTIKLKAGRNLSDDLANIKLIKGLGGEETKIQLDLNQALELQQAIDFGKKAKELGIDFWEEPIKFNNFKQLRELKRKTEINLILDESIKNIEDLKKAIRLKAIDVLNVKLSRLGGLTNSLQLIKLIQNKGLEIQIGCSEELGLGTSGQMHLASILQKVKGIEGLGSRRLGFDIIKENLTFKKGFLPLLNYRSGLGVSFCRQSLIGAGRKLGFVVLTKNNLQKPFNFYAGYYRSRIKSKFVNGFLFAQNLAKNLWQKKS